MTTWVPDVLGPGWQQTTFDLGADAEGAVVATVVRRESSDGDASDGSGGVSERPAVLYLHGYNDYFFQTHVADQLQAHGYDFYALDLRKHGRSLRSWQTPNYCADLREYLPELERTVHLVREELGHDRLVVMAHSTGALLASLWVHHRRVGVDALVLNSPWFDLNENWVNRVVVTWVLDRLGPLRPMTMLRRIASPYTLHLHVAHGGRWEFDLDLKPVLEFGARAGWVRAIRRGHARLARGLDIPVPVLVCTAASSGPDRADNPALARQDTILDVAHMAARTPLLGRDVMLVPIPDAVHDLALSAEPARTRYLTTVLEWLGERVPGPVPRA